MTKRFTFDEDANEDYMYEIGVFSDNGKVMETTDVLNCLNNLHEENEQLKKALVELKEIGDYQYGRIKELSDENEQLKSEINMLKTTIGRNEGYIDRLTHKGEWG